MALLRRTNTFFMQRPPIIPTLLFCLVTTVTYKYNNVNYALFLCSLGRLTHCRSQFSLFLPVLRFASSATGGAQLRTSTVRLNVGVCTVPNAPRPGSWQAEGLTEGVAINKSSPDTTPPKLSPFTGKVSRRSRDEMGAALSCQVP